MPRRGVVGDGVIGAGPGIGGLIVTHSAVQIVVALTTVQRIIARAAEQAVIARLARNDISATAGKHQIIARLKREQFGQLAAGDGITARCAGVRVSDHNARAGHGACRQSRQKQPAVQNVIAAIGHADGDGVQATDDDWCNDGQHLADAVIFDRQRAAGVVLKIGRSWCVG